MGNELTTATLDPSRGLAPMRPMPYSVNDQYVGSCCGTGLQGPLAGKTSTEALPNRRQDIAFDLTLLGAAADTISIAPQTREVGTVGVGNVGTPVGLNRKLTFEDGNFQKDGFLFNRYCFLMTGISICPAGLVAIVPHGGEEVEYTPLAVTDTLGLDTSVATILARAVSMTMQSPDEEAIARLDNIALWPCQLVVGNSSTDRSGNSSLDRDFMALQVAFVWMSANNDNPTMQFILHSTKLIANTAGGTGLTPTVTIGGLQVDVIRFLMKYSVRIWGHVICCPAIDVCSTV
jgi:hypothetical protein